MRVPGESFFEDGGGAPANYGAARERITRIKSLSLVNFRGIRRLDKFLNTDADVILITGPNGFGKTCLIDALCLLLCGHHYRDSNTLLFRKDGKPAGSATIEAQVLISREKETEEERTVEVYIPADFPKEPFRITGFTWPDDIKPEVIARASFFYQDLLGYHFDEEDAEITLRGFIAPFPPEVEEARKQVKNTLKQLEGAEKQLFTFPGIPGENEIDRQRREAARDFNDAWAKLVSTVDKMNIPLPKRSADWLLLISGKNLRHGWEGELRNLANECLALSPLPEFEPLPENAGPELSLRRIDLLLQNTERNIASRLQDRQQLWALIASLPDGGFLLEQQIMPAQEKILEELQKEIGVLGEELKIVNDLAQHFQNPDGPGLMEILTALRRYGEKWATLPLVNTGFNPPQQVYEWLKTALKFFYFEGQGLDEVLARWQERVEKEVSRIRNLISEKEGEFQLKYRVLAASKKIWELSSRSVVVADILDKEKQSRPGDLTKEAVLSFLSNAGGEKVPLAADPMQVPASVHAAIQRWLQIEQLSKKREESLKTAKGYDAARDLFETIRKALKTEISGRESLLEKVIELPEKEAERLANLVNSIFFRFRIVKGLWPIRFEQGQRARGRERAATWNVVTKDGRRLGTFSTGQKAQLAVSLLLGLNIALDRLITHNIIGLDDFTTALDMAQLPREATLLRQIAYGAENGDFNPDFPRRQLFIVSHHEDLTHRLIDFLIPPGGRKMHILNFTGWDLESGPEISQFEVEAARTMSKKTREEFGRRLKNLLKSKW